MLGTKLYIHTVKSKRAAFLPLCKRLCSIDHWVVIDLYRRFRSRKKVNCWGLYLVTTIYQSIGWRIVHFCPQTRRYETYSRLVDHNSPQCDFSPGIIYGLLTCVVRAGSSGTCDKGSKTKCCHYQCRLI